MNKHFEFFEQLDQLLAEEDVILDGLKLALSKGWMSQAEIDEAFAEYHDKRMADYLGVVALSESPTPNMPS